MPGPREDTAKNLGFNLVRGARNVSNPYEVELLTTQYATVLELLLQQKTSRLRGRTLSGTHVGKMASPVQHIGALEFKAPSGRYSPLTPQTPQYVRRWVFPSDKDLPVLVDQFDMLKTIIDPKSGINSAVMAAANRVFDDVIITAAFASASTGVDASSLSTETFDTTKYKVADDFGAAASTGMTYPKLVEAWRILRHYQNDMEAASPCVVIGSQQEDDLKKQQEVINRDYGGGTVTTTEGRVSRVAGFDVIVSERLQTDLTLRNCIAFVQDGLYLGVWNDTTTQITRRTDLSSHPWQLYSMLSCGATRMQPGKVIQIDCADTTGADPTAP